MFKKILAIGLICIAVFSTNAVADHRCRSSVVIYRPRPTVYYSRPVYRPAYPVYHRPIAHCREVYYRPIPYRTVYYYESYRPRYVIYSD